ncbi:hypothetical protein [Pseudomonas sp. NPDC089401]|uniref:hypothetical protein n=1 Tax=Pseudomonas sp. NPDC089401 TaxID=3364462 RepID=UPI003829030F
MRHWGKRGMVVAAALFQVSCSDWQPNTFTLVGELPPNFSYSARALYVPKLDAECTVKDWRWSMPEYNRPWRGEYEAEIKIDISTHMKGCQMVLDAVEIRIYARWSDATPVDRTDSDVAAALDIYSYYQGKHKRTLKGNDEDTFYGECRWMFRTAGKDRKLIKKLSCQQDTDRGESGEGMVYAVYTIDQLRGKTIKMNIRLNEEEQPTEQNKWVKFPNGWKRCMGIGYEDTYGYCNGDVSNFSDFTGPNGEICSIHPGCRE